MIPEKILLLNPRSQYEGDCSKIVTSNVQRHRAVTQRRDTAYIMDIVQECSGQTRRQVKRKKARVLVGVE